MAQYVQMSLGDLQQELQRRSEMFAQVAKPASSREEIPEPGKPPLPEPPGVAEPIGEVSPSEPPPVTSPARAQDARMQALRQATTSLTPGA